MEFALDLGRAFFEADQFQIEARHLFQNGHGLVVIPHPFGAHGQQLLGHLDLERAALGVADAEVLSRTVLIAPPALAAWLSALRQTLNQRRAQDRTEAGKLPEEFLSARHEPVRLGVSPYLNH